MVNLPEPSEQPARAMGERARVRGPRNPHNWRYPFRRVPRSEPTGLLELEALAQQTVKLQEKHGYKTEKSYDIAMDLLRQQYNLNFIVVCEKCGGPHVNDELIAPER